MAAVQSWSWPGGQPRSIDGTPATGLSFCTQEMGNRHFFPTSDVSAMPTLELRHRRFPGGRDLPAMVAHVALNGESYGVGAGLTHNVRGCEMNSLWNRLYQRNGETDKDDRGWRQEYSVAGGLGERTHAKAALVRRTTDSGDAGLVEAGVSLSHTTPYGTIAPSVACVRNTAAQGKNGRAAALELVSAPLGESGLKLYFTHRYRKFEDEKAFHGNEGGVTVPLPAGELTLGAVLETRCQELLKRTSIASTSLGDAQLALKVGFDATL
eukprot:TRINITY_DN33720_c0_g1_i1.p1 TRINITY_DN33720_c0_g1~~TRINITY_DN33720_c0_g1_i1.p1  ORF type:complete len:267 (+),score=35.49 TRINITY_DN33720_c0_g1_i1:96-896(+)